MAINKQNFEPPLFWIQRIQEGFWFNLTLLDTDLIFPSASVSSSLSPFPPSRDGYKARIVSLLSVVNGGLDGCVDSFDNEESISSVALVNSSATTDQISGASAFSTGVQGPGTS